MHRRGPRHNGRGKGGTVEDGDKAGEAIVLDQAVRPVARQAGIVGSERLAGGSGSENNGWRKHAPCGLEEVGSVGSCRESNSKWSIRTRG